MLCLSTANIVVDKAKKKCSYPSPRKDPHLDNINCGLFAHPINQHVYWSGFDLGASSCPQAESWSANTVKASASAAAAAAAASTAAVAATKRASSASLPLFALSPPAEMDYIASPPITHPQMVRPLLVLPVVSPVVWHLLSMLRIFTSSTIVRCVPSCLCAMALSTMMEYLPLIYLQCRGRQSSREIIHCLLPPPTWLEAVKASYSVISNV